MPSLKPGGGVPVGDGALWMATASSPEKKAAAWKLVKFFSEPAQQAAFAIGSKGGYIPIRRAALDDPALQALWAQNPALRVPYDQLESGPTNPATVGSVIGDYQGVRDAVAEGLTRMFAERRVAEEGARRRPAAGRRGHQGVQRPLGRVAPYRLTMTTEALAPRPTVWARPTRAPSTWRAPARAAQLARRARPPGRAPTRRAARPSRAGRRSGSPAGGRPCAVAPLVEQLARLAAARTARAPRRRAARGRRRCPGTRRRRGRPGRGRPPRRRRRRRACVGGGIVVVVDAATAGSPRRARCPGRCERSAAAASVTASAVAASARRSTTAAAPSLGEHSIHRCSGSHTTRDAEHLLGRDRLAEHGVGVVRRRCARFFTHDRGEVLLRDARLAHAAAGPAARSRRASPSARPAPATARRTTSG